MRRLYGGMDQVLISVAPLPSCDHPLLPGRVGGTLTRAGRWATRRMFNHHGKSDTIRVGWSRDEAKGHRAGV